MSSDASLRSTTIEAAMRTKFGSLSDWKRPKLAHTFGSNDLGFVDEFEKRLDGTRRRVQTALEAMSDDELRDIHDELSEPLSIRESQWGSLEAREISLLHTARPSAIEYGFGHPNLTADFEYWARMPKLSLHEVSVLSVGGDPRKVTEQYVEGRLRKKNEKKRLWAADEFLLQQRNIFSRYFHHTGWGFVAEPIFRVKQWIDQMDIIVHPDFYAALGKREDKRAALSSTEDQSKPMSRQERDTLLKLIAAMSCEQYSYNPNARRSTAPSNIKDDLERVGLGMDEKTIRKWLKEASGLVAPEYWQDEQ